MVVLVDGQESEMVDVLDRGLAYGDGVFRTFRVCATAIRSWPRQYRKLADDCRTLGIRCPEQSTLAADVRRVTSAREECVVKVIVTRGSGGRGYAPAAGAARCIVLAAPLPAHALLDFEAGVAVRWCRTRYARQPLLAGVKHLNRLENVLARGEWVAPGIPEGIMCDCAGDVIGGTMSNLFIVEAGRLVTPVLTRSGVAGVQRERLLDACHAHAVTCSVERISPERLLAADGVLLVNSVIGIWRVARLGDRQWPFIPALERLRVWLACDDD